MWRFGVSIFKRKIPVGEANFASTDVDQPIFDFFEELRTSLGKYFATGGNFGGADLLPIKAAQEK